MSKKIWLFALLCVAAGFALSFFGVVNVTSILAQIPGQIAGGLQQVTTNPAEWVTSNIAWIAGSLTVVGAVYGGVKSLANNQKTSYEAQLHEKQAEVSHLSDDYLHLDDQKKALSKVLEQKDTEINKLRSTYGDIEKTNEKLQAEVTQVRRDYGDMKAILEEYKQRLKISKVEPIP